MEEQILDLINNLTVPGTILKLGRLGLLTDANVVEGIAQLSLATCGLPLKTVEKLKADIENKLIGTPGIKAATINTIERTPSDLNRVKNVVVVMSGKGGVGKSTVSGLLAISLKRLGYQVGILDADITGPSIPKMFGLSEKPLGNECGFLPVTTGGGIEVMSISLILGNDTDAVVWRGPLIAKAIAQFWTEVLWGELDYLIVDLPPGTSDAALTTIQQIPLSGVVMVTTPQALAGMIVRKAIDMVTQMNTPVLGLVENMAYFPDPESGRQLEIFGPSNLESLTTDYKLLTLARLPIDPAIAVLCDKGNLEHYDGREAAALGSALVGLLSAPGDKRHH